MEALQSMKYLLSISIVWVCLFQLAQPQCPNVCSGCSSGTTTCTGCATDFPNATGVASDTTCILNSTLYVSPLYIPDMPLLTKTNTCGSKFPNPIPGNFTTGQTVVAYTDNALLPHYYVRVIASVLFVGKWANSNTVSMFIDTQSYSRAYAPGGNLTQSSTCGNEPSFTWSMFGKIDNGTAHTSKDLKVQFQANKCNGCSSSCKCGWFITEIMILIKYCDPSCLVCSDVSNTACSVCETGYWLTNTTCDLACALGYYENPNGTNNCLPCNSSCAQCTSKTVCTVCKTGFVFFPLNNTCPSQCYDGYYNDSATNQCEKCIDNCSKCSAYPVPCQSCNQGWFLYESDCINPCPAGLFESVETNTCEDCAVYCIGVSISMYIPAGENGLSALCIDMSFTHDLDFSTFPMATFQNIKFSNAMISLDAFNVTYTQLNSSSYRITLEPLGYAFMVNESVTVTTMTYGGSDVVGKDNRPLRNDSYDKSSKLTYTYIKPPSMSSAEKEVVAMFAQTSSSLNNATTLPGVQEIKKFGFLLLLLNSLQITSCLVLINAILPQNLYEGIRFLASMIFFDVPPWESDSTATKLIFVPPVSQYTRRRMATVMNEFYFRRTGFSSEFLMDCYSQLIIIACGYIFLGISVVLSRKYDKLRKARPYMETGLAWFHEISIMYVTLTLLFEFVYFDSSNPVRIASLIMCVVTTVYFLCYHAYRYWDFLGYPGVEITSSKYQYYADRYGHMLRFIRFSEYPEEERCWSLKLWIRPYNYHTISYVKKFAMMMALTTFYSEAFAQPLVLVAIQVCEIIRFCFTWPFCSKWRNVYRLVLELILLTIFGLIYFIGLIVYNLIRGSDPQWAAWFFMFGWIALALIMLYNLGFLVLACINAYQALKSTNRELMDQARRDFYFKKLNDEEKHDRVDINRMNELVKKGNLNNRRTEKLPNVDFRIEYYRIQQDPWGYSVDVRAIFQLFMESEFNYKHDSNNLAQGRNFERVVMISKDSEFYPIIDNIYNTYSGDKAVAVTLKTFLNVEQSRFHSGEKVPITADKLHQEVFTEFEGGQQPKTQTLNKMLRGFPAPERLLLSLH